MENVQEIIRFALSFLAANYGDATEDIYVEFKLKDVMKVYELFEEGVLYVIYGGTDQDGDPLYWSNDIGWVDLSSATIFTPVEKDELNLPIPHGLSLVFAVWVELPLK